MVDAEKKLKMRIRRILSLAGLEQTQTSSVLNDVVDQIVETFRAYSDADEETKKSVYVAGEEKIFQLIRNAELRSKTSGSLV